MGGPFESLKVNPKSRPDLHPQPHCTHPPHPETGHPFVIDSQTEFSNKTLDTLRPRSLRALRTFAPTLRPHAHTLRPGVGTPVPGTQSKPMKTAGVVHFFFFFFFFFGAVALHMYAPQPRSHFSVWFFSDAQPLSTRSMSPSDRIMNAPLE